MKRILKAAVPALAVALMIAGPAMAGTSKQATCQKIHAELASGKTPAQVEKDLKVSKSTMDHCNAKVASAKKHGSKTGSTSTSQPAN
jgi:hypothetical protein